jgi:hypothetical protein
LALVRKIIDDEAPVETIAPGRMVPRVVHALQRVLAKQPVMRYQQAGSFAEAFLHGEPPPPPMPTPIMEEPASSATLLPPATPSLATVEATPVTLVPPAPAYTYAHARRRSVEPRVTPRFVSFPMLATMTLLVTTITLTRLAWTNWAQPILDSVRTPAIGAPSQTAQGLTPPFPPTLLTLAGNQRLTEIALGTASQTMVVAMSSAEQNGALAALVGTQDAPPTVRLLPSSTSTDTPNHQRRRPRKPPPKRRRKRPLNCQPRPQSSPLLQVNWGDGLPIPAGMPPVTAMIWSSTR